MLTLFFLCFGCGITVAGEDSNDDDDDGHDDDDDDDSDEVVEVAEVVGAHDDAEGKGKESLFFFSFLLQENVDNIFFLSFGWLHGTAADGKKDDKEIFGIGDYVHTKGHC